MSAVASRSALWFTVFTEHSTVVAFTGFLDRIAAKPAGKIQVVADRDPVR